MVTASRSRRGVVAALAAATIASGAAVATAPSAHAAPTQPGIHQVDQLGDLTYQALFGAGVQVYEYATTVRGTSDSTGITPRYYYTVLRKLHNPREGKPGSLRYGFVGLGPGTQLPEVFALYSRLHPEPHNLGNFYFRVNPQTLQPLSYDPHPLPCPKLISGPIGPLTGGAAILGNRCGG